jgi:hypothetical protein
LAIAIVAALTAASGVVVVTTRWGPQRGLEPLAAS